MECAAGDREAGRVPQVELLACWGFCRHGRFGDRLMRQLERQPQAAV